MWVFTDGDNDAALGTYARSGAGERSDQVMLSWTFSERTDRRTKGRALTVSRLGTWTPATVRGPSRPHGVARRRPELPYRSPPRSTQGTWTPSSTSLCPTCRWVGTRRARGTEVWFTRNTMRRMRT